MRALLVLSCLWPSLALAQDVVGRSVIDGAEVELLSDFTWRYVDATPLEADCLAVTTRLSFCGDPAQWEKTDLANPDVAAAFRHDDRHYAQYIVEDIGTADGLSPELMRKLVIDNAARAAGKDSSDIIVFTVEDAEVDGRDGETMVYQGDIDGFTFLFANTLILDETMTLQAITFAVTETYTEKHRALHDAFLAATRIAE